jgi:hypothetical protein
VSAIPCSPAPCCGTAAKCLELDRARVRCSSIRVRGLNHPAALPEDNLPLEIRTAGIDLECHQILAVDGRFHLPVQPQFGGMDSGSPDIQRKGCGFAELRDRVCLWSQRKRLQSQSRALRGWHNPTRRGASPRPVTTTGTATATFCGLMAPEMSRFGS